MKNFIKNKLTPSDTEDIAMSDTYVLNLICPITRKRLINPARGFNCLHIESFELESFIKLNILKIRLECPICKNEAPINKLGFDKYLKNILNECKDDQVVINKESKWVAINKNNNVKIQTNDNCYDLTNENGNETIYLSDDSIIEKSLSQNKNSNLASQSQKHLQPNNTHTNVQTIQTHMPSQVFKQPESLISRLNDKENQSPAVPNSRPQIPDSDDDYDAMDKRRGQNRNKFRKERDDYHGNPNEPINDMNSNSSSMRRNKGGGGGDIMMGNGGGGANGNANGMGGMANGAYGQHGDFRRRTLGGGVGGGGHYSHKEFDDLDDDDLAHQTYRETGFR